MDDLIKRQAAIDALCSECQGRCVPCDNYPCGEVKAIEVLPSAQPEIVRCKDCIRYGKDNCFMKIQMLWELKPDDFCSYAERRQDEDDQTAGL